VGKRLYDSEFDERITRLAKKGLATIRLFLRAARPLCADEELSRLRDGANFGCKAVTMYVAHQLAKKPRER
jgi:hypothetical protein